MTLLFYSLAIFFSYALQFYVVMEIVGKNVIAPKVPERWLNFADVTARIVLNVFVSKWFCLNTFPNRWQQYNA